jgi:hypothetical protein
MIELMQVLGESGHHVMVRYDPLRETNNFTVVIDNLRIGDTDNPKELLENYMLSIIMAKEIEKTTQDLS